MIYRTDIEIGRKNEDGIYRSGLYFHLNIGDEITLKQLLNQAEKQARRICKQRGEKFIECMVRRITIPK